MFGSKFLRKNTTVARVLGIVLFIAAWEVGGVLMNNKVFLPTFSSIIASFPTLIGNGELGNGLRSSLYVLGVGYSTAVAVAIPLGLFLGRYKALDNLFDTLILALYSTPRIALLPLVIIWLGLGTEAKVFIVFIITVLPVLINVRAGVKSVSQDYIDVGLSFGSNERQLFRKIVLPASVPFIMAGLEIGAGRATTAVVVAEMFTAITGLGELLVYYGNWFMTDVMFVPVLCYAGIGVTLTQICRYIGRRVAPWYGLQVTG